MTSYRDKRKQELADLKHDARKIWAPTSWRKGTERPPTDEEYARVCALYPDFPRDKVNVMVDGGCIWLKMPGRQIRFDDTPAKREYRDPRTKVYKAGDKTTVATNPDGSPYVFKTGSRAEQIQELKAAAKAGNPELSDINVFE